MNPKMIAVTSSSVLGYQYIASTATLLLAFKSGAAASGSSGAGAYSYAGVSLQVADQFVRAPSKGKFFRSNIRDRYATTKLSEEEVGALLANFPIQSAPPAKRARTTKLAELIRIYPCLNAYF